MKQVLGFSIRTGYTDNQIAALNKLEDLYAGLCDKGLNADNSFVLANYLSIFSPEYYQAKFPLETAKSPVKGGIVIMLGIVYASVNHGQRKEEGTPEVGTRVLRERRRETAVAAVAVAAAAAERKQTVAARNPVEVQRTRQRERRRRRRR